MISVWAAILTMLSLGVAAAFWAARWSRRRSQLATLPLALPAVAWLFVHPLVIGNGLLAAVILPVADVIIWSNLQPICAGTLAGVAWAKLGSSPYQRLTLLLPLCVFALYRTLEPAIGTPAMLHAAAQTNGVIRQSSKSSCSAAASATALNFVGINATEAEMAELCLTKSRGTFTLGIYRGLKLKTADSNYRVEVFRGSFEEFLRLPPAPAVVSITVQGDRTVLLGASHSVMLYPLSPDDKMQIGDPFTGRYHMTRDAMNEVWLNEALRIVPRK